MLDAICSRRFRTWALLALVAAMVMSAAWVMSSQVTAADVLVSEAKGRVSQQQTRLDAATSKTGSTGWDEASQKAAQSAVDAWATKRLSWTSPDRRDVPAGCEAMDTPDAASVSSTSVWPMSVGSYTALVTRDDGVWAIELSIDDDGAVGAVTSCTHVSNS